MSTSALASLTATYTDSEGEEDERENNVENTDSQSPPDSVSGSRSAPSSIRSSPSVPTTRVAKLVSYHDDNIASDDEVEIEDEPPQEKVVENDKDKLQEPVNNADDEDMMIPGEPPGSCSADLQDKLAKLYEKMQTQQMDMNSVIQKRKDFRNPSIYEKLIQFCELNELGTNYPPTIYDPLKWSKESYYEELSDVQRADMERREKARRSKLDLVSKKAEDNKNKRKSKWDMPGGGAIKVNQPGLVAPPTLTSSATGTKSTIISAFGSLPKKPKI
uniref:SAP30-binding protein n=1 Tax=Dendroctonus ponderosae TaxID=77166 RepID=J3JYZ1_DENPD|nr:unknown [Dendroctonus ponderosae]